MLMMRRLDGVLRRMEQELNAGDNFEVLANLCQLIFKITVACTLPLTCHDVTSMSVAAAAELTPTNSHKNLKIPPNMGRRTLVEGALYDTDGCSSVL